MRTAVHAPGKTYIVVKQIRVWLRSGFHVFYSLQTDTHSGEEQKNQDEETNLRSAPKNCIPVVISTSALQRPYPIVHPTHINQVLIRLIILEGNKCHNCKV